MEAMPAEDIKKAVKGRLTGLTGREKITGLSIDTRTIQKGDLFVALKGSRSDGHDYVGMAVKKGASAALVEKTIEGRPCIVVKSSKQALGEIAAFYRSRFKKPTVIAVTDSSGKTTVKEMIAAVLSGKGKVMMSRGNFNNDLGLPLSLAGLDRSHRFAVMEMGMNAGGEINYLCQIARPGIGVITNIGEAHIGRFKSKRALANAKLELIKALPAKGKAVLNRDDVYLKSWCGKKDGLSFGLSDKADVQVVKTWVRLSGTHVVLRFKNEEEMIKLKTLGTHHARNAAAAVAAGISCGLSFKPACRALDGFKPVAKMRTELRRVGKGYLINDAYNSNPQSAAAAVNLLAELAVKGKKVMVAGDMLELGGLSKEAHDELGRLIALAGVDCLLATGKHSRRTVRAAVKAGLTNSVFYPDINDLKKALPKAMKQSALILIKGSRGIGLEVLVPVIKKTWTQGGS